MMLSLEARIEIMCREHGTATSPECAACARMGRIDAAYGKLLADREQFLRRLNAELRKSELVIRGLQ